jgi:nitroimidazol reductase NimA-like FMN-containing flavoprotein (pyridoxamine 5'-phosphate oxidase superfamily)
VNPGRPPTDRTRVRRLPEKQVESTEVRDSILAAGIVAHLAVSDEHGWPFVLPVAYAPWRDSVVFHGSTGSRLFRGLAAGQPTCLTVTLVDGLVLARSAFESSINYRSVMVLGQAAAVVGEDKADALRTISEHLLPGRWDSIRHPSKKEDAATMVLSLPLTEWSAKVGEGFAEDPVEDLSPDTFGGSWAGRVPMYTTLGTPEPDPFATGIELPEHVRSWLGE